MELGGSNQDGGVVNMTRAIEALSPLLNHPRRTIIQVEALVTAAAALLLLQLILGSCRRRWHKSFIKYGLQVCNGIMFPFIVYTLSTMQSTPIKNSFYPVWAAFLIMASAGTIAVQQYYFCNSFDNKYLEGIIECFKYGFYVIMFSLLMNPNTYTLKTALNPKWRPTKSRLSSYCVIALVCFVLTTKVCESLFLTAMRYKREGSLLIGMINKIIPPAQAVVAKCEYDSDPQSMKGYKYAVIYRPSRLITIDQIWDCCVNTADSQALKDLSLSCALFQRLVRQHYFGEVCPETSHTKDHDFVFKKLLSSEGDFKRPFRIIEVELGFCYDFFFTKYYYTFALLNSSQPGIQYFALLKIILILTVGVFAIRKSLVLETPNPIIQVHTSGADYYITLLVLFVDLIVELVQAAVLLASN